MDFVILAREITVRWPFEVHIVKEKITMLLQLTGVITQSHFSTKIQSFHS